MRSPGALVVAIGGSIRNRIRVLSVDDHPLVREGIATVINRQPDMQLVAHAVNGHEAIKAFGMHKPDIALMDLRLPDMSGIDAMVAIRTQFPEARIIILTTFDGDSEIQRAFAHGARSYILKSTPPNEMAETIRQVHAGKKRLPADVATILAEYLSEDALTEREVEVLKLAMGGNRNRDIANHLFIAEETVKAHLKHAMGKLGAVDRTQAVSIALRRGLIQL